MADEGAAIAVIRPIAARPGGHRYAIGIGAGQNVVTIGLIATSIDLFALFIQPGLFADFIAIAVQRVEGVGDHYSLGVEPRAVADAVAGIDRAGTEIGPPGLAGNAGGLGEDPALAVGACKSAEIGAVARALAGDEEAHRGILGVSRPRARRQDRRAGDDNCWFIHDVLSSQV